MYNYYYYYYYVRIQYTYINYLDLAKLYGCIYILYYFVDRYVRTYVRVGIYYESFTPTIHDVT